MKTMPTVLAALMLAAGLTTAAAQAADDPIKILFVGNSYTFGRVDPVMSYNAANVHDLTAGFYAVNQTGTNPWEPHPWGGVPGIFKQMTVEAGLNYDVSISARNAATLRGQFLQTTTGWNMRENVASQDWGVVVLQEQSDAALPAGKGANANIAQFQAYANQFETFIHNGAAQSYTETQLYGGLANCMATGLSQTSCGITRKIAANTKADANTKVYLTDTWARPDMAFAHKNIVSDPNTPDGAPIVDTSGGPNGTAATLYYSNLQDMTTDLHNTIYGVAAANPNFAGVIAAGDAFQLAMNSGLAMSSGFYDANGVFVPASSTGPIDLFWKDGLHASMYGSYLDALVQFGTITGVDPLSLGVGEQAAKDLGIDPTIALALEHVASEQLGFAATVPEPSTWALLGAGLGFVGLRSRRQRRQQD
ncbi:PEP-CTERM sorting domain-containing protein [Paucibacter sp. R3-3]|uniref:PEP-CTERM sorting domain-containing protein n=1 Tax=Roseateles agri TaxID=3098619 RepID=A0ABU5DD99_9BURK|nr:PEP-CTERM sorting domain-containing protein [Paucibacter sp. R3-3]MDY0743776.1 PEP-CTERM sorting domain-containing protein [Paucibacter sp. R3-3]